MKLCVLCAYVYAGIYLYLYVLAFCIYAPSPSHVAITSFSVVMDEKGLI